MILQRKVRIGKTVFANFAPASYKEPPLTSYLPRYGAGVEYPLTYKQGSFDTGDWNFHSLPRDLERFTLIANEGAQHLEECRIESNRHERMLLFFDFPNRFYYRVHFDTSTVSFFSSDVWIATRVDDIGALGVHSPLIMSAIPRMESWIKLSTSLIC